MDPDNLSHQLLVREGDIVEDTPAQEGVGQLLLRVGGDDHHRAVLGGDGLARLRDVELHPVQLPQQVVGELQVRLVNLVDEQNHLLVGGEGLAQLAQLHVFGDVVHALAAELAVVQPLHHVVDVQAVLGLGGGLDVPDNQLFVQRRRDGLRQHGLARARLPLDQQGLLEHHGDIHRPEQLRIGHIILTSLEFVHSEILPGLLGPSNIHVPHFKAFRPKTQPLSREMGRQKGGWPLYETRPAAFPPGLPVSSPRLSCITLWENALR